MLTQGVTQEEAREILGKDFSSIEDALRLFPDLEHPKKYRTNMATVPYSASFLEQRQGSLIICPGFNRLGGDIFSLQTLDGMFFETSMPRISHHNKSAPHKQRFSVTGAANFPKHQTWNQSSWSGAEDFFSGTAEPRWYAVSKTPKSLYKQIDIFGQDAVMGPRRRRENAFVYTWIAWLHFLRTGELLWPKVSVWTSDILPDGRRMAVGGWEDSERPIWTLEPSGPALNRFAKTVPSYEPNMF